ncbi:MAG TPA: hypothetical protein VG122_09695 [Gemmata sp.]|nr:hypothetical protein [Gemmata sp.]
MNRSSFYFVPTLASLEHREGPATLTPNSMLFPTDFLIADNVLISDSSNGATGTIHSVPGVKSGLANVTEPILIHSPNTADKPDQTTTGHDSQLLNQHDSLSQLTRGISVALPGEVIPSVPSKPSNNIVELPTHAQGHVYAPPHRHPPVRVPVN